MENLSNLVATIVLFGGGIGAFKYFTKGDNNKSLWTGLVALLVSSVLYVQTREAWKVVIGAVITFVGKIIEKFTGAM